MGESPEAGSRPLVAFGARLRERRRELGLTQEALAYRCGLHWTYVGQIERGRRNIGLLNIIRIAAALETTPAALVDDIKP